MKAIKTLLFISFITFCSSSFGQNMRIEGTVYDTAGVVPLENAMAMAVRMKDSLLLGFARTNKNGKFLLTGFPVDTFSLIIDHPDFDEKRYFIVGHAGNDSIFIPTISMPDKSQSLEEVVIYAYKDPIYYKGDTLVYVADSFNVGPNAVVEDLLKKLPGIEVDENGQIKSQGQDINKVLVDGDEFFGTDPTIATKNLGAEGIETVEIYEKENEDRGEGEDEKIQVLDLKLKDAYKSGYFGRVSMASDLALTPFDGQIGTNPFYEGELLFNKFNGAQKFSVFALGSNTPRSNFGWGDLNKFGLSNEETDGNRWQGGTTSNTSGIPQTMKAGIYFSDKWGKKDKVKFGFNYSYYNDRLVATTKSETQYFVADSSYFSDDFSGDTTRNTSHRINMNLSFPVDSFTVLEIKPSVRYDQAYSGSIDSTTFAGDDRVQSLRTGIYNSNDSEGYEFDTKVRLDRKFRKKNRRLEVEYNFEAVDNKTYGNLYSTNAYLSSSFSDTTDQRKDNLNSSMSHIGLVRYTEPLAKRLKLEFEYMYENGFGTQNKYTDDFDYTTQTYSTRVDSLSNDFNNTRQQHRAGLKLIYEGKKHTVSGGARVRNIDIYNANFTTGFDINQNITNILPMFRYQFKPSMSKRFNVTYRTNSQRPSINDLQPVPDNTNPNQIKEGNANLVPNYVHTVNLMFNTWQAMTGKYIWMGGMANYTDNAFADSSSYDSYGRTISKTVNVDGNIFSSIYGGAGLPLYKRIIELRPNFNGSYNRYSNYISGEQNITQNLAIGAGTNLLFKWDSLEVDLSGNFTYNNPTSSISQVGSTPFSTQRYQVKLKWRMKHGFTIGTDATYNINNQPGDGFYDLEYFIWNAEFSKSFLKTENLVISIIGNDILNQNVSASRTVNGNMITDFQTTIISRYFLLKASLRFNNNKTKENDFRMH